MKVWGCMKDKKQEKHKQMINLNKHYIYKIIKIISCRILNIGRVKIYNRAQIKRTDLFLELSRKIIKLLITIRVW